MTFRLPEALSETDDTKALALLRRYYGSPHGSNGAHAGAAFDTWDSTGTRSADANRFTADDLVAVTFLSVRPKSSVPRALLRDRAETEKSARTEPVGQPGRLPILRRPAAKPQSVPGG